MTIILAWLLADFLSGLGHWAQDKMLDRTSRFKFINAVKEDNDLHHLHPTRLTKYTLWENTKYSAMVSVPSFCVLFYFDVHNIVSLAVLLTAFANLVHRYAHTPYLKVPLPIKVLQATGIFLSLNHHRPHHFDEHGLILKEQASKRYCVMSCYLNPLLDYIGFFDVLDDVACVLRGRS